MSRVALTPERITTACVAVADADGLAAVSMRNVAKQLGVQAMSIYHHVPNKEQMMASLTEWLYAQFHIPAVQDPWQAAMRERAESMRDVLRAHPWGLDLMDAQRNPGPQVLQQLNAALGCLRHNGFTVRQATHAFWVIDAFIYGYVLTDRNLPIAAGAPAREMAAELALDPAVYPHLVEMVQELVVEGEYRYADEFDAGIDMILSSLERLLID